MSRKFFSQKPIISFLAVAALAAATLVSGAAQAGGGGGSPHGGHGGPGMHGHYHHWHHWAHYDRIYVRPVSYAVRTTTPGPCTCLTKNYTPEGKVVFQDLCTKEMASAPVDGSSDQAQTEPQPNNFAGRTYQDFLKSNPQKPELQKN